MVKVCKHALAAPASIYRLTSTIYKLREIERHASRPTRENTSTASAIMTCGLIRSPNRSLKSCDFLLHSRCRKDKRPNGNFAQMVLDTRLLLHWSCVGISRSRTTDDHVILP